MPPTKSPAEAEVNGPKTMDIVWRGDTYTIPSAPERAHPKVMRAFERGKAFEALEAMFGAERLDKLLDDPDLEMGDLNDLSTAIAEAWGLKTAGE